MPTILGYTTAKMTPSLLAYLRLTSFAEFCFHTHLTLQCFPRTLHFLKFSIKLDRKNGTY